MFYIVITTKCLDGVSTKETSLKPTQKSGQVTCEEFDFLILGSGEAGKYLAWTLGKQGKRVALVERKYIGGSCPNIACLPTKNIIHSAKVASYFWRSEEFGITKDNCRINMSGVRDRKRRMVDSLVELHLGNFRASGVELVIGTGAFISPKTIEVSLPDGGNRILRGEKVIISTGSRATLETIPGLYEAQPLTHVEALDLDQIPEHILIIGGGYIGLEFAQAMRRFGSRVTILERNDRLAHREDTDVSEGLLHLLQDEGIEVALNVQVTRVEGKSGLGVRVQAQQVDSTIVVEGSHLLLAAGRTPNTDSIGLSNAGVEVTGQGYIKVNDRLETTAPDVWAVGDCAGSPHFTHVAFDDFRIVRDNLAGGNRVTTGRQVPFCLFTDPEFARIGLSEMEAERAGIPYRLTKMPMAAFHRPRTLSETGGFMKALVEADGDRILGFSMLGVGAGEVAAMVQITMLAGLPYTILRDAVLTHPTLAESLGPLFSALPGPV